MEAARSMIRSTPSAHTSSAPRSRSAAPSPVAIVIWYGMVPLYQSAKRVSVSGPISATRWSTAGDSGSAPSFFSSTTDSVAARSASARWSGLSTASSRMSA